MPIITFITLLVSVLLNLFQFSSQNPTKGYQVIEVLDGDTFVIDKSQKVRLLSVDAPKLEYCLGQESKQFLESLLLGKTVYLDEIVADRLGRIVALVYADNQLINQQMAHAGMVKFNSIDSSQKEIIVDAEKYAKENQIGIFSPKCTQTENPDNPNCNIKGNISRDKEGIYSFPGCSGYSQTIIDKYLGDQWFCDEKQAQQAGFRRAKTCYDLKY